MVFRLKSLRRLETFARIILLNPKTTSAWAYNRNKGLK